jgi:hypothetical protein
MSELHDTPEDADVILSGTEYRELLVANRDLRNEIDLRVEQGNALNTDKEIFKKRALTAESANREKDAEISDLRKSLIQAGREAGAFLADEVSTTFLRGVPEEIKLKLASLRASVGGEKWIEIKEGCAVPQYGETIHAICGASIGDLWQEIFESSYTMGWEEMAACGLTYWKKVTWPVAPPSLPNEKEL